jgi:hypothetical protein
MQLAAYQEGLINARVAVPGLSRWIGSSEMRLIESKSLPPPPTMQLQNIPLPLVTFRAG